MISKYIFIQSIQICTQKEKFHYITFFHPMKIFLYYMNFSFDAFKVKESQLIRQIHVIF